MNQKIKFQLLLLDDFNVIVTDEKIEEGDCIINHYDKSTKIYDGLDSYHPLKWQKIIASDEPHFNLPDIDYNGFNFKSHQFTWDDMRKIFNYGIQLTNYAWLNRKESSGKIPEFNQLGYQYARSLYNSDCYNIEIESVYWNHYPEDSLDNQKIKIIKVL